MTTLQYDLPLELLWSFSAWDSNSCKCISQKAQWHQAGPNVHSFIKHILAKCPTYDRHWTRHWSYNDEKSGKSGLRGVSRMRREGEGIQSIIHQSRTCGLQFSLEREQKWPIWSLRGNVFPDEGNSTEKNSRCLRAWHMTGLKEINKAGLSFEIRSKEWSRRNMR